jgi:hypothetical protein
MGSVIIVTLFHAAYNMANNEIIPDFIPEMNRMFANYEWLYTVLGVLALVLIVRTKGRLSYEAEHAAPPEDAPSSKEVERRISAPNMRSG